MLNYISNNTNIESDGPPTLAITKKYWAVFSFIQLKKPMTVHSNKMTLITICWKQKKIILHEPHHKFTRHGLLKLNSTDQSQWLPWHSRLSAAHAYILFTRNISLMTQWVSCVSILIFTVSHWAEYILWPYSCPKDANIHMGEIQRPQKKSPMRMTATWTSFRLPNSTHCRPNNNMACCLRALWYQVRPWVNTEEHRARLDSSFHLGNRITSLNP